MAIECSDTFAIAFAITAECTISLLNVADINVPRGDDSTRFTKHFIYNIGTAPDDTSDNLGFFLDWTYITPDLVTVSHTFYPGDPETDPSVPDPKSARVDAEVGFDINRAEGLGIRGEVSIPFTVRLNTGT